MTRAPKLAPTGYSYADLACRFIFAGGTVVIAAMYTKDAAGFVPAVIAGGMVLNPSSGLGVIARTMRWFRSKK